MCNGYFKENSQRDCICAMFCLLDWKIVVLLSETRWIYPRRLEKTGTGSFQCRGVSGTVDIFLALLLVGITLVPFILKGIFPLIIKLRLNIFTIQQWFIGQLSRDMRFPKMWYVRPAKAQISLHIRAD